MLRDEFRSWENNHTKFGNSPDDEHFKIADAAQRTQPLNSFRSSGKTQDRVGVSGRLGMAVGLVSHIGGHAWAGNVMVYLPSNHRLEDGRLSPLAGKGIWYGRVEPRHVEGIVNETIQKGRVIEQLLRGVHGDITAD